jgi:hypothetical protein
MGICWSAAWVYLVKLKLSGNGIGKNRHMGCGICPMNGWPDALSFHLVI